MYKIASNKGIVSVVGKTSPRLFVEEEVADKALKLAADEGVERVLEFLVEHERAYPNLKRVITYALDRLSAVEEFLQ